MRPLTLGGLVLVCAASAPNARPGAPAPLTVAPIRSELARHQQVEHALNRLAYGARPGDVERVSAMGVERWIAAQLAPERIDDRAADSLLAYFRALEMPTSGLTALFRELRMARRDTSRAGDAAEMRDSRRTLQQSLGAVATAKLTRAVASERQLYEQMVDFWENHFSVFSGKGQTRLYIPAYDRDVIRPHAMGKFRDLLGAVAKSPAMLFYLDNAQSTADTGRATMRPLRVQLGRRRGLNENY